MYTWTLPGRCIFIHTLSYMAHGAKGTLKPLLFVFLNYAKSLLCGSDYSLNDSVPAANNERHRWKTEENKTLEKVLGVTSPLSSGSVAPGVGRSPSQRVFKRPGFAQVKKPGAARLFQGLIWRAGCANRGDTSLSMRQDWLLAGARRLLLSPYADFFFNINLPNPSLAC